MPHPPPRKLLYPPTRRDKVVDDYHGTPVADPYRWLEAPQTPERHAWLEAQQRLTSAFLAAIPTRDVTSATHRAVELPTLFCAILRQAAGTFSGIMPDCNNRLYSIGKPHSTASRSRYLTPIS